MYSIICEIDSNENFSKFNTINMKKTVRNMILKFSKI